MIVNHIKLAKALLKLAEIATDKGNLIFEGKLAEGVEVFVEKDGDIVSAEDGEYIYEEKKIVVKEGKVEAIEDVIKEEPTEEPAPEPEPIKEEEVPVVEEPIVAEPDEKDLRIAELEAALIEKEALVAELEAKVKELVEKVTEKDEALKMSADIPAKEKVKRLPKVENGLKFNVLNK